MFILTKSRDLGRMKHPFSRGNTQGATQKLTQPSAEVQCTGQRVAAPHRKGSYTGLLQWLMLVKTLGASKFFRLQDPSYIYTYSMWTSQHDPPLPILFPSPIATPQHWCNSHNNYVLLWQIQSHITSLFSGHHLKN